MDNHFNIQFNFYNSVSETIKSYFINAATFWETIITHDIPDFNGIDDLLVDVTLPEIDGAGTWWQPYRNILGGGTPMSYRPSELSSTMLPVTGFMQFDVVDVNAMIKEGTFNDVVLHELGHVLGLGSSLWDKNHLKSGNYYIGSHALAAYRELTGNSPLTASKGIPLEPTGGQGTAGSHWAEEIFDNELMTGFLNNKNAISSMTLGALEDLGYSIDYSKSDFYHLPNDFFNTVVNYDADKLLATADHILWGLLGSERIIGLSDDEELFGLTGDDYLLAGGGNDSLVGGYGNNYLNGGFGYDTAHQTGAFSDYYLYIKNNTITLTHKITGIQNSFDDIEYFDFENGSDLLIAHSGGEAVAKFLVGTWLHRELTTAESNYVQQYLATSLPLDIAKVFLTLPEAFAFKNKTAYELLTDFADKAQFLKLPFIREVVGTTGNDQAILPTGLGLIVDALGGHDVLHVNGSQNDSHLDVKGGNIELTSLLEGSMLNLKNIEMLVFDSSQETIAIAHNAVEGILGRLVHTFLDKNPDIELWQLGREVLSQGIDANVILNWFTAQNGLSQLNNHDFVQTIYENTFNRAASPDELSYYQTQLDNGSLERGWLGVELAQTPEAIAVLGAQVMVMEGWI